MVGARPEERLHLGEDLPGRRQFDGPSTALAGEARFNFGAGVHVEFAIQQQKPVSPFRTCETEQLITLKSWEVKCRFSNWPAGQRVTMIFTGAYRIAAGFAPASTTSLSLGRSVRVDGPTVGKGPFVLSAELIFCGLQAAGCG